LFICGPFDDFLEDNISESPFHPLVTNRFGGCETQANCVKTNSSVISPTSGADRVQGGFVIGSLDIR